MTGQVSTSVVKFSHRFQFSGHTGIHHRGTRHASSPRVVPWPNLSDRDATGALPPSLAKKWLKRCQSWRELTGMVMAA